MYCRFSTEEKHQKSPGFFFFVEPSKVFTFSTVNVVLKVFLRLLSCVLLSVTCCLSAPSTLAVPLCPCLPSVYKHTLYKVAVHASVTKWLAVTSDSSSHFLCVRVCVCVCVCVSPWRSLCVRLSVSVSAFFYMSTCLATIQHPSPR